MNRIFDISETDKVLSKDKKIITDVKTVISDIKKLALRVLADSSKVPGEVKAGDISGAVSTVRNNISNDTYDKAKKKLDICEEQIKKIDRIDQKFSENMDVITQSTNTVATKLA